MKFSAQTKFKIAFALLVTCSATAMHTAQAEVIKHIEDRQVEGVVINHAISPDGHFLYSTTISPTEFHIHARDPRTGTLLSEIQTLVASDFIAGKAPSFFPQGMLVSPDGKQVYISATFGIAGDSALNFGGSVLRFDVSNIGNVSYTNRVLTEGAQYSLAMTNDGKFMYVGSTGSRARVSVIRRAANGNITTIQTIKRDVNGNEFKNTQEITVSPDNKQLYVSSVSFDGHLYVFDINNDGTLSNTQTFINEELVTSSHLNAGDTPVTGSGGFGTAITKDGRFFYSVSGYGDEADSITIFRRDSNGRLVFLNNVLAPLSDSGANRILFSANADLIISPNQKYIYTFDPIKEVIGVWSRNQSTGNLSFLGKVTNIDGVGGAKIVISNDERHLYLNGNGQIFVYDLRADLSLVKTDAIDPVNTSGVIDYTLSVTNDFGSDAQNVVITDTLPSGASFISGAVNSNTGFCSANGQIVTCTMGQIFEGDGFSATIKVRAPATVGQIVNAATVTSDQLDTNTVNNTDSEVTNIGTGSAPVITTPTPTTTPVTTPPVTQSNDNGSGGSMPMGVLMLMLTSMLFRRKKAS